TENVTEKRKQLILQLMHKNPNITTTEIASNLSVTRRTIARDIEQLKVQQKVKRKGTDKSGSWEINN
ncbi:MAG TPA: transcriptional regulator, partial [Bacteroidetes bacterium]|nr:transcriptional regulator [Bacteroidota bacterium]